MLDWERVTSSADLSHCCELLLKTPSATVWQFPFHAERFRSSFVRPVYLRYGPANAPEAFVCILAVGLRPLLFGVVTDGPVGLREGGISLEHIRGFQRWARQEGYVFVRFATRNKDLLDALSNIADVARYNPLRSVFAPTTQLFVKLDEDGAMLSSFQRIARRDVRNALAAGYEIQASDSHDLLRELWPVCAAMSQRKRRYHAPLDGFARTMQLAQPYQCARVYGAFLSGTPVAMLLVLHDATIVHSYAAAVAVERLGNNTSPSCLLYWTAMREARQSGLQFFNLGSPSGPVHTFKQKFNPTDVVYPEPHVLVLNKFIYQCWKKAQPVMLAGHSAIRKCGSLLRR